MKKMISWLLAAALAASMLALPTAAARTGHFSDLPENSAAPVEALRLMGVLDGYGDGTFRPNASLTRAQFCKMTICAVNREDELELYRSVTVYPDVRPSHWAAGYINMAAKGERIISGFSDGKFYPDRVVTLAQAATVLLRLLGYKDETMGAVWPNGYLAVASRVGLLDGMDKSNGNAPLTRGQAAQLFTNLFQADCVGEEGAGAGSLLSRIGMETKENVILASSSAKGPDGKNTAFQLTNGQVYQLADSKASSGVLDGSRGTLVLKNGKALTFLPDRKGSSRTAVLASAEALLLTDRTGAKYSVENSTTAFYNGKEQSWSELYTWLNPGTALTLYLGAAGNVEYIIIGGGDAANEAVVVYERGSAAGFDSLTGGTGGWTIYKNGLPATSNDLRAYDVAVYSGATNSIRVSDARVTGYYEDCRPSPTAAEYVTVLGYEFPVLTTAQASLAAFKPGDQITLLLTEDNQVGGAVKGGSLPGGTLGIVKSISSGAAEVELLCGVTAKGAADGASAAAGQLVRVSSEKKGELQIYRQGGGDVTGTLDLSARRVGNAGIAENVKVYAYGDNGLEMISLSDLGGGTLPGSRVSYARLNWAGQVDVLVLGRYDSGAVLYGRAVVTIKRNQAEQMNEYHLEVSNGARSIGPIPMTHDVNTGDYVAASTNSSGTQFTAVRKLGRLTDVPNSAWSSRESVTVGGRSYTVPSDVACYNRDTGTWISLDAARAYAGRADLYESGDGVIRIIEVGAP
ncbi:MAG: S-layer homology domain-containing protein [Oscillibacter sp.]|nr:S-layer homology domain-containing protein [Oscillibacter sp.]